MTIHKLHSKRSVVKRNEIQSTFFNCDSIGHAQERDKTRRGYTLRDYFVTDAEWKRIYSPAAQKANFGSALESEFVRGSRESWDLAN